MLTRQELKRALEKRFLGSGELQGLPIRTRSKRAKEMVCEAVGLPVPGSFQRTSPRFPEQNLDVSVQAANNFQVWNQELDPNRRYAFIILDGGRTVARVEVLTGAEVAELATSDTLTSKYQARFANYAERQVTVHGGDTRVLRQFALRAAAGAKQKNPGAMPGPGLLSIDKVAGRLSMLVDSVIEDPGAIQERRRGEALHRAVCMALGYGRYADTGQHPDIPNQLLEIKLQTSPTIDLGLVDPSATGRLPEPFPAPLRFADVRYAVFGAIKPDADSVELVSLTVVTGERFFEVFSRFGGRGVNEKLQIRLPSEWFS